MNPFPKLQALLLVGILSVSRFVEAQEPPTPAGHTDESDPVLEAKKRYAAGTRAMQQRQYAEAALHFEAAQAAAPSGVALLGSALAWDAAGQPQRAADAYSRALDEPGMSKTQTTQAATRLGALERSLGTLVVSGEDGMRVQLDDNVDSSVPARLHGAPGTHKLTVWAKGKIAGRREVYLRLGRPETIAVPWREDAPVGAPPPPKTVFIERPQSATPFVRMAGAGMVGAGVVSLVGAIAFTASANYASSEASRANPQNGGVSTFGSTLGALAGASWISAAVLVGGGITLLALPLDEKGPTAVSMRVGPGSVAVGGQF